MSLLAAHSASVSAAAAETSLQSSSRKIHSLCLLQICKQLRRQSGVLLCYSLLRIHIRGRNTMDNASVAPRPMSLHLLEEITNGFSDDRKVGTGSYGVVYRGEYKNGETIAVKLLHYIPGLNDEKFMEEYLNLATLQHKNVVRLVGYCNETRREVQPFNGKMVLAEETKRALCFEYMHNGSLDQYLSGEFNGHDWRTRYTIIKGICQGLKYLHEELQSPMYHLDIKPANVLLDESMVPKLADFGLSRLFGGEKTQRTASAIGTLGYVPPEYIDAGIISNKFDVFSLGVILIKIMTGPTGYYRSEEMTPHEYIELVHANWMKRLLAASVHLQNSCSEQVKRCIEIALSCVDADRHKRPNIGLIVCQLNETDTLIQSPQKDIGSSTSKICHCISTEGELMDIPLNTLISYPLHVTDNRGKVHEVTVSTICQPDNDTPIFKIIDCGSDLYAIDVHPTEPWILAGHKRGYVSVWNHQTQARLMAFDISKSKLTSLGFVSRFIQNSEIEIYAVRFIAQKQWFIAGASDGQIHVYTYTTNQKRKKFQAHSRNVKSLAVHPTDRFVLSSSSDELIKLWNWENGWECVRTFRAHTSQVCSVKFNPLTVSNTFASASWDRTVKIWSMFSDTPIITFKYEKAGLMRSLDYFIVRGNREYIVGGSTDGTAHIWDLETKTCIRHVKGLQGYGVCIAVVDCHPGDPILVTVSQDRKVSFCNSTTHRYQNMVDFELGLIMDFAYIKDTKSLVVLGYQGIAIMEIS